MKGEFNFSKRMQKSTIKVLLIEDNEADSRLLKELLNEAKPNKHAVYAAYSANEGMTLLQEENFDIVIIDLNLPDKKGMEAITSIRSINQRIPIVVLGEQPNEKLAMQITQMEVQDCLIKGQGDGYLIDKVIKYAIERKKDIEEFSHLVN